MDEIGSKNQQTHPLYSIDREIVDRLLSNDSPNDSDITDLARLLVRYEEFPGAVDLKQDFLKIMKSWDMDKFKLNLLAKKIWEKGFRPGQNSDEAVGSSFDTADNENN